jgi:ubiquinone/menaquinone biosynthesis C-methylase UbiE
MTSGEEIPGAVRGPAPMPISPAIFDEEHDALGRSELIWRLAAQAYGEDYPAEVQPWGLTTWWVLGRCVSGLRVGPGQVLVDLACGRGGPGLWLARATGAELLGVDWSPVAVEAAAARTPAFVTAERARFVVGDLAASGLADDCADAAVCLDAVFFAEDRIAALAEVERLLRPGGRYAFTAPETDTPTRPSHVTDWTPLIEAAGLELEGKEEVPRFAEQLTRMYELWLEQLDELRAEIGDTAAERLETEARTVGPTLASRRHLFLVARRPS